MSPERLADYPGVATTKEQGYANFEISVWYGILAPTGTPRDIISRLNTELVKAFAQRDVYERVDKTGLTPAPQSLEEAAQFVRREAENCKEKRGRRSKPRSVAAQASR